MSEVYTDWDAHEAVRVPLPVQPGGAEEADVWSTDGWGAHVFVPGRDVDLPREVGLVKAASDVFHRHVSHLPQPDFMQARSDPWSFGDRVAWEGAEPVGDAATLEVITGLRHRLGPVSAQRQVIHGDILPNVLLADGLAPAVIDWPPYFRPAQLANAIAVTDAVTFRGAPTRICLRSGQEVRTGPSCSSGPCSTDSAPPGSSRLATR